MSGVNWPSEYQLEVEETAVKKVLQLSQVNSDSVTCLKIKCVVVFLNIYIDSIFVASRALLW